MSEDEVEAGWHDLLFGVRRSIRYHRRRQDFFGSMNIVAAVGIWCTSVALVAAIRHAADTAVASYGALMGAALGLFLLAMWFKLRMLRCAAAYARLADEFADLEIEMIALVEPSPADLARLGVRRLEIEKREPHVKRALDILCHNEMIRSYGYGRPRRIGPVRRLLANFVDFENSVFDEVPGPPAEEAAAAP